jgi:HlyD family secretion protein
MTASVEIITERKNGVVSVPIAAVTTRSNTPQVRGSGQGPPNNDAPVEEDKKPKKEEVLRKLCLSM